MNPLKKFQERAQALEAELRQMLEAAGENGLSAEQTKAYDEKRAQLDEVYASIERAKALEADGRAVDPPEPPDSRDGLTPKDGKDRSKTRVGEDREATRPFKSLGEQLRSVIAACAPGATPDKRLLAINQRVATGLSEGVNADGGFLVQEDFVAGILKRVYDTGAILSRVRRRGISSGANRMVLNAIDETSRATGSRLGGVQAYWLDEAEEKTPSKPKFRKINLQLRKIAALMYATDELLQDTGFMEAEAEEACSSEIRFMVEDAILRGDGDGKPLGIYESSALVEVPADVGQDPQTITLTNVLNMYARMWARSMGNAVWLINQQAIPQIATLSLNGYPIYLAPGGISGNPFGTLLGRPVIVVEQASALGEVGDITFVDLNEYVFADKGGIQAASSIHVRFLFDETAFRFVYRCDGQPIWNSALTPYQGTDTISAFVALAAREQGS